MNERKQIAIISILLTLVFVTMIFSFAYIPQIKSENDKKFIPKDYFKLYFYGDISDAYQTDKEVIKVYGLCFDSEIKSICVYENIYFVWSEYFESTREDYFFSPTELVEHGGYGICRDIAVFRMAVLKKLRISAEFVFVPEHVYIRSFENGNVYELDNGVIRSEAIL